MKPAGITRARSGTTEALTNAVIDLCKESRPARMASLAELQQLAAEYAEDAELAGESCAPEEIRRRKARARVLARVVDLVKAAHDHGRELTTRLHATAEELTANG